jgi:hypothetical protein
MKSEGKHWHQVASETLYYAAEVLASMGRATSMVFWPAGNLPFRAVLALVRKPPAFVLKLPVERSIVR